MPSKPKAVADGMHSATPHLICDAAAEGATVRMPPADMFWGDRHGVLEDLPKAMQQAMSAQAGR
jgi:hypothetical protein